MNELESRLKRWQAAGLLDSNAADRIRAWEILQGETPISGAVWGGLVALILGGLLLACGVILFINAHWDRFGPGERFALVMTMVAVFHLGGAVFRERFLGLSTALHAVGTVTTGAAIALVGQIFNLQEHWPAAVLMWAVAAVAGWLLLREQAQQILTLLLIPAWMQSELVYSFTGHIGLWPYAGRFLFTWAILYVTFFTGSTRSAVRWVLFTVGTIAAIVGVAFMADGWASYWGLQGMVLLSTRVWCWIAIAAIPLVIAAFHGHKGLIPVAGALAVAIALPWCEHVEPDLAANVLVGVFAISFIWYGVRQVSRALVNLGVMGFAAATLWFYFSSVFDKVGRSLGLISLGVLFLFGGWALEKIRRRLMARMEEGPRPSQPSNVQGVPGGAA